MIVQCKTCNSYFDDEFRSTICPHSTFAANDGLNNFAHYPLSYMSSDAPTTEQEQDYYDSMPSVKHPSEDQ